VKAVKVLSRRKAQADVEMEVDVLRRIRYSISLIERPYASVEWTLKESSVFKTNTGGWYLELLGRSKTEVTYVADIGFPLPIPKSLSNMILQVRLPKMLELFKQRVEADHAKVASAR
jgi:ribosome-associated toxin RatA of RatAB toxin-antitoxin module